jgi:hypothetical protein
VDGRTHGDVADRQGVAHADRRFGAADDGCADFQVARSNDVATLAVGIAHQSDVGRTVRVVFNALDLGGDTVLVALEVHHTVVVLVTTALVAVVM